MWPARVDRIRYIYCGLEAFSKTAIPAHVEAFASIFGNVHTSRDTGAAGVCLRFNACLLRYLLLPVATHHPHTSNAVQINFAVRSASCFLIKEGSMIGIRDT